MNQLKTNIQWSNLSLLKVKELHIKIQSSSSDYSRDGLARGLQQPRQYLK